MQTSIDYISLHTSSFSPPCSVSLPCPRSRHPQVTHSPDLALRLHIISHAIKHNRATHRHMENDDDIGLKTFAHLPISQSPSKQEHRQHAPPPAPRPAFALPVRPKSNQAPVPSPLPPATTIPKDLPHAEQTVQAQVLHPAIMVCYHFIHHYICGHTRPEMKFQPRFCLIVRSSR